MVGATYTVTYDIITNLSTTPAVLREFSAAVAELGASAKQIGQLASNFKSLTSQTKGMLKFSVAANYVALALKDLAKVGNTTINIKTEPAKSNLMGLNRELDAIIRKIKTINSSTITTGGAVVGGQAAKKSTTKAASGGATSGSVAAMVPSRPAMSGTPSLKTLNLSNAHLNKVVKRMNRAMAQNGTSIMPVPTPSPVQPKVPKTPKQPTRTPRVSAKRAYTNGWPYKTLGPTPLPNDGGMAVGMLKGFGIAFAISGIGELTSRIVNQAAEYDNIIKTVENILKSHDEKGNFAKRFSSMANTIRKVGMETKYKVTEVAAAAKFLAMAGLDLEDIQHAIRPIADIALVGDTELGETADLVTNIMTAYNLPAQKMRLAADVMTNTFTMSNTTLTEIAEAYKYSASLLSMGGMSFEEATAAIGVLGDAGIKGSQAGTTLRMIMNNITKPTKSMKQAWAQLGISTTDANGQQKDLVDIFRELHDKQATLEDMYKLFRVTAAPGAAALMAHVDKWETIRAENYLSGGLSAKLAEEKKNTLQGLWAQLISVFVDQGVTAFNGIQNILRGWMKSTINWLHSEGFARGLNDFASSMLEFIRILKMSLKWFGMLAKFAAPLIKWWVKFSLTIWPIMQAISKIRSVYFALSWLRDSSRKFGDFIRGTHHAGQAVQQASVAFNQAAVNLNSTKQMLLAGCTPVAKGTGQLLMLPQNAPQLTGTATGITGFRYNTFSNGLLQRVPGNAWIAGGNRVLHPKQWFKGSPYFTKNALRRLDVGAQKVMFGAGNMGAMAASMGAGYMAFNQFAKEDKNFADWTSGGLYSAAALAAMAGGWGLVVAGVLAAVGAVTQYISAVINAGKAADELHKINQQWFYADGVMIDQNAAGIHKWLQTVYREHRSIREEVELRIEKTRELLGLESHAGVSKADISTTVFDQIYGQLRQGGDFYGGWDVLNTLYEDQKEYLEKIGIDPHTIYRGAQNGVHLYPEPEIFGLLLNRYGYTGDDFEVVNYWDQAGNMAILNEALHGKYAQQVLEDYMNRLHKIMETRSGDKQAQINNLVKDFEKNYGLEHWNSLKINLNKKLDEKGWEDYVKNGNLKDDWLFNYGVWMGLRDKLGDKADLAGKYAAFVKAKENNAPDLFEQYERIYSTMTQDGTGMALKGIGSQAWIEAMGFEHGTFVNGAEGAQIVLKQYEDLKRKLLNEGLTDEVIDNNPRFKEEMQKISAFAEKANYYLWFDKQYQAGKSLEDIAKMYAPYQGFRYGDNVWSGDKWVNSPLATLNEKLTPEYMYNLGKAYGQGEKDGKNGSWAAGSTGTGDWSYRPIKNGLLGLHTGAATLGKKALNPTLPNPSGWKAPMLLNGSQGDDAAGAADAFSDTVDSTGLGRDNRQKGGDGTRSSDYKSSKTNHAVPKQLNINIQNLMNVESVDLTNPHKAEVVNRLKDEVAYALYEAAADGALMLNNLT